MSNVVDVTRYLTAMEKARADAESMGFPEPKTIDEANRMYEAAEKFAADLAALRDAAQLDVLSAICKAGGDPKPQLLESLRATLVVAEEAIGSARIEAMQL